MEEDKNASSNLGNDGQESGGSPPPNNAPNHPVPRLKKDVNASSNLGNDRQESGGSPPPNNAPNHPVPRLKKEEASSSPAHPIPRVVPLAVERTPSPKPILSGKNYCVNHHDVEAHYKCVKCHNFYCPDCPEETVPMSGLPTHICRDCRELCIFLDPYKKEDLPPTRKEFAKMLMNSYKYPFEGFGIIMVLVGGVCFTFARILTIVPFVGWLIALFILGYQTNYMFRVVNYSARGEKEPPDWPEFRGLWDAINYAFTFFAIVIMTFGPFIALSLILTPMNPFIWPLLFLGIALFPMNFLIVAMFKSAGAMNPFFVINSILKVPHEYAIACFVLFLAGAVRYPLSWVVDSLPIIGMFSQEIVFLYMLMVEMRILGLIYWVNEEKLDWFEQRPSESSYL